MKPWAKKYIPGLLNIFGLALLMFWSFCAFMAHAWIEAPSNRILIDTVFFFSGPILCWLSWRGSRIASIVLFGAVIFIIWLPPWAITGFPEMTTASILAVIGALALQYFGYNNNEVPGSKEL